MRTFIIFNIIMAIILISFLALAQGILILKKGAVMYVRAAERRIK